MHQRYILTLRVRYSALECLVGLLLQLAKILILIRQTQDKKQISEAKF